MPYEPQYSKGDWIMFLKAGEPVIGVVLCVGDYENAARGGREYVTTSGVVRERHVLESRKSPEGQGE